MNYSREIVTETAFMTFTLRVVYLQFDGGGICYEFEIDDARGVREMSACEYGSPMPALIDAYASVCGRALDRR